MKALILVDIQYDFISGGALAVPGGEQIIPTVNELQKQFERVVATQDWHPAEHGSFAANHTGKKPGEFIDLNGLEQILWPVHCVQGTNGAEFVADLEFGKVEKVFRKGTDPGIDSYSGFFDNGHRQATGLGDYLKEQGIKDVYICGLAADYCVKFTALDAQKLGFKTHLFTDATKGVELNTGDTQAAFDELEKAGVVLLSAGQSVG